MAMNSKLEDLIAKFSQNAGLENIPPSEGVWKFSADGNVFGVTGDGEGRVWLFGEIPFADPAKKEALLKSAMEANYFHRGTGGATFALNPDTGALTLITSERLDALGEEAFFAFVEKFVNTLAVWNGISDGSRPSAESSAEPPAESSAAPKFAYEAGFIQV
ncbi:MAG: type III secretion system chaperone [Kiritimatiellae bacterium]|nr:type III secretion system chaperone [Kiritimatiellia bacterium]